MKTNEELKGNRGADLNASEQLNIFGEPIEEKPCECCYQCAHFAEFKEPRTYNAHDVFGMCLELSRYGCFLAYPVYIPEAKCNNFKKVRKEGERE